MRYIGNTYRIGKMEDKTLPMSIYELVYDTIE